MAALGAQLCRVLLWLLAAAAAAAASARAEGPAAAAPRSGYDYLAPETKAMQDDDFSNPGFFWVDRGAALWRETAGAAGKSCADCHGDARTSMKGVATVYPKVEPSLGKPVNLEQRINLCRVRRMQAPPFEYESRELVALTTFIAYQSRGMKVDVTIDGPAAPFYEKGRAFYFRRRGQFDLACYQCHDANAGKMLRGERLSEGHTNGFPSYKLKWQEVGSTHRQFRRCNSLARSEPYDYGADEYVNLELYLAYRGRGLPIEAPSVRP
ncbi:MAG TPA: sulfur oxidation c-type cytochrome SoxA [Alphaproteobacteria bacterium]